MSLLRDTSRVHGGLSLRPGDLWLHTFMHESVGFVAFICLVIKNPRAAQSLGLLHDAGPAWPWLKALGPRKRAYCSNANPRQSDTIL